MKLVMCFFLIFFPGNIIFGGSLPSKPITSSPELRVLFIGNSLTYANNLPEVISKIAKAAKQPKFSYKMIAYPNYSLEDHWIGREAEKTLLKEKWDFVVMQQGPSGSVAGRKMLIEYSRKFAALIRQNGGKPAFYAVWTSAFRLKDFTEIIKSYQLAAKLTGGVLFPVSKAWQNILKNYPQIKLYSSDKFHPGEAGTYLAALVIFRGIYGKTLIGLPNQIRIDFDTVISVSKKEAKILQETAEAVYGNADEIRKKI